MEEESIEDRLTNLIAQTETFDLSVGIAIEDARITASVILDFFNVTEK